MMEDIKFSIIVPVYKIEENRLRECLNSIKEQNDKDIEIILIDDGSPDRCGEICDEIADTDSRFVVIHSLNKGVSHARNLGIKTAKSDCLIFVDGDDQLLPGTINFIKESPKQDLLIFDYCINGHSKKGTNRIINFSKKEDLATIQASFIGGPNINGLNYTGAPWGKVYKKSIIINNKCFFDEKLPRSQDNEFNFRYMNYVKTCTYIETEIYNYTINLNSAMRKYWEKAFENSNELLKTIMGELDNGLVPTLCRTAFLDFTFSKLRDVIDTNIYHTDNPLSSHERLILLREICNSKYYKECLRKKTLTNFSFNDLLLFTLKANLYHSAAFLIRVRKMIKGLR